MVLNLTAGNSYRPEVWPDFGFLVVLYLENLSIRLGFIPLVPQSGMPQVQAMGSAPFFLLSVVLVAAYLWRTVEGRVLDGEGTRVFAVAVLSAMALFPLTALARNYGVSLLRRPEIYMGRRGALVPSVLALLLVWLWLGRPRPRGARRMAAAGLLAWATFCALFEPFYQVPEPLRPFVWEWPVQAAEIEEAVRARRAGTLREDRVVGIISCRPDSPAWKVRDLTISAGGAPTPPPPRR